MCVHDKCELIWLYKAHKNNDRIHSKETCKKILGKLQDTKEALINVYGNNWEKHWLGKIPKFLR